MSCKLANIVHRFVTVQIQIKTFHWQTFSYSHHKTSDDLFDVITKTIDEFVELFMGMEDRRLDFSGKNAGKSIRLTNVSVNGIIKILKDFAVFLQKLDNENLTSDLLNLRDELLGHIHKTLYLLTLK